MRESTLLCMFEFCGIFAWKTHKNEMKSYIAAVVFVRMVDLDHVQNGRFGSDADFRFKVVRVQRAELSFAI